MIFCRKCGRYNDDGAPACNTCTADLETFGHASFQSTPVNVAAFSNVALAAAPAAVMAAPSVEGTALMAAGPVVGTAVMEAPPVEGSEGETDPVFDRDKFLLRQKALAIKEKYYVTDDQGSPLMFVERPALLLQQLVMLGGVALAFFGGSFFMAFLMGLIGPALGNTLAPIFSLVGFVAVLVLTAVVFVLLVPKRHITFYKDDSKTQKMLEIKQVNKIEFPYAKFTILDTAGNIIGSLRKNVLFDYIRRRWQVMSASGLQLCTAKEDSIILSLLRRTGIPIFLFLRTNFIFLRGEDVIGEFNRKLTLLDRYVLDLTADHQRILDRRIALALGVMLDTGERR
jgi:uncharacterized protein YxjI